MEAAGIDQGDTGQKEEIFQIRSVDVEARVEGVEVERPQQKSTAGEVRIARSLIERKSEGFVMARTGKRICRDLESRCAAVEVALPRNPERRQFSRCVRVSSGTFAHELQ